MSPIGKNKCSYSPMKNKGLIAPIKSSEDVDVDDPIKKPDASKIIINGKTLSVGPASPEIQLQLVTNAGKKVGYVKNNNAETFIEG